MDLNSERELFAAAVDLPPGSRDAWLADNCQDPALRERVRELLRAHDAAPEYALERVPERLGPYRFLERIGTGSMGEVYLAEQTTPVSRRVAVKLVKLGMDTRECLARFEVERQSLAMMSHPGIARILDAGATPLGRPYFVMEYVPGVPLTRFCAERNLPLRDRLELFTEVCDAVNHAHQRGVIHRDLKPTNILVMEMDGVPAPRIIDFGIAKAATAGALGSDPHTRVGNLVGTPEYMSPEQAMLSPLDVDTRTDVYSLGVILYELLTGALPRAVTAGMAPAEIQRRLTEQEPVPPSTRLRGDKETVRSEMDWIVLKALQLDRARRYATVAELAADVRRYLANEPVLARPPTALYLLGKFVARHRVVAAIAVTLSVSIVAFGALMALQSRELARQRDAARFETQRAEASNDFMSLMLEEVGEDGRPLSPVELLDRGVALIDSQYSTDKRFVAAMLLQMSRRYMDLEATDRQFLVLARAGDIAERLGDDELLAAVGCATAQSHLDANRRDAAAAALAGAQAALARLDDVPVRVGVDCLRAQADLAQSRGNRAEALELLGQARQNLENSGSTRGLQYVAVLTDMGLQHFNAGEWREALALNRITSDVLDRNGRGGTMSRVITLSNQGSILMRAGEVLEGERLIAEAMRRQSALRPDRAATSGVAVSRGLALNRLGRYKESAALLGEAISQASAEGSPLWLARAHLQLAEALVSSDSGGAAASLGMARSIWSSDPVTHADRLRDLRRVEAELALASGDLDGARATIDSAVVEAGYPARRTASGLAAALRTSARVYLAMKDATRAEVAAADSARIAAAGALDPARSADVGEANWLVAQARAARGDQTGAKMAARGALPALQTGLGPEHPLTLEVQRWLR